MARTPPVAVRSVVAAAHAWRFAAPRDERPWVTVPRNCSRPVPGAVTRRADLDPSEVVVLDGISTTSPLRTVLDCARVLPFGWGLAVADSALRTGLVRRGEVRRAAAASSGRGSRALRRVVAHMNSKAASALESLLRAWLIDLALGPVTLQQRLEPDGHPFDIGVADVRMLFEADGAEHRLDPVRQTLDCEDLVTAAVGDHVCLRITWSQAVNRPAWLAQAILDIAARQRARIRREQAARRRAAARRTRAQAEHDEGSAA